MIDEIKLPDPTQVTPDIATLTRQMIKGEEAGYMQFHTAYFNRLLAYLVVVTRDEQLAREALQTTLLRVARHVKRFDSEPAFWSWLTVLARSSVADETRRSSRYMAVLQRFFKHAVVEHDSQTEQTYFRIKELLEINLAALPLEDRELIERKYFEGESVRQLAQHGQVSEKAIESRLVRIRQKLRETVLSQLKNER
ncbi:MAG TPA: sigma-70 family RNA polymerase sigma factor [Candidatus Limnocylindrales bacterium]|jgi:RNA polymerase sigma-70 factor (ECF subfamily)|nr:sigma-70 family RNA polymerase sigma factor [Candidatus Limnocylindrales bacterium]